jgi:hypothetical protein
VSGRKRAWHQHVHEEELGAEARIFEGKGAHQNGELRKQGRAVLCERGLAKVPMEDAAEASVSSVQTNSPTHEQA